MKILCVANEAKGFVRKFLVPEIVAMTSMGWEVDVACEMNAEIPEAHKCFSMPWTRNPYSISTFVGIKKLKAIIEANRYDVVYTMTPVGGLVGRLAAKGIKTYHPSVIYFAHGFHFFHGSSLKSWMLYFPVEKFLSRYTDVLITLNHEDFNLSCSRFHAKENVLSLGVGVDLHKYTALPLNSEELERYYQEFCISDKTIVLFYAADIYKTKNQQYLLRVCNILKRNGLIFKLLLAGRDLTNGKFQQAIIQNGLANEVTLLGFRDDCPKLIHLATFCTASSLREGLPVNIIEAMAAGVPVVATRNRGHNELIQNGVNGFLVSPKKPSQMAEIIQSCNADVSWKAGLIKEEQRTAEKYSLETTMPFLLSVYQKALKYKK